MLDKSRVELHLLSLGLPLHLVTAYAEQISRWVDNSGVEWTVDRLKSVKTAFFETLSNPHESYTPMTGWAVRRNRSGRRILKDPLVHRVLTLPNTQGNLRIKEAFCRTYTVLRLLRPSQKQVKKMKSAIQSPYTGTTELNSSSPRLRTLSELRPATSTTIARCSAEARSCKMLPDFLGSSKRSPTVHWERRFGTARVQGPFFGTASRNDTKVALWRDLLMRDRMSHDLWESQTQAVSHSLGYAETLPLNYEDEKVNLPAGRVVILQDVGAKARWIANPFLTFQAFGEPLKVKLQEYLLLQYPEVFVHDQDAARAELVSWLMEGKTVWSYDCTSFTDRFPVVYQRIVLENLRTQGIASQFDIEAFDLVIGKEWMYHDELIKWEVGQPLGYGPSFFLATLTHAVLLDRLATECCASPRSFMVVGDDVVICDKRLAEAYLSEMTALGVEINLSKSLVSDRYGEFLGKLVSTWGVNPSIKVKQLEKHSQFHKAFNFYGIAALRHLPDELVGKCSGLFLPVELGGSDLRPNGISYSDWLAITDQEGFARVKRSKVLSAFYNGNPVEESSKSLTMQLRSKYFKENSPMALGLADWARLLNRSVTTLNRWTGFPDNPRTSTFSAEKSEVLRTGWSNTFVHLQDTAHSLHRLSDVSTAIVLEMKHGYSINLTEKPYTANHIRKTYERKADSSEEQSGLHEHGRKPFKTRRVIARWLRGREGKEASASKVKDFTQRFYSFQRNQDGNL